MQDRPNFGALSKPRSFSVAFGYEHNPKLLKKNQIKKNKSNFWIMEKYLSYNFHIWKNSCHRDFVQFSVRMALYGIVR